jgi:ABC-type sugar transport system ATPase subunit
LDEPTVGLSLSETKKTLDFVQNIKKSGRSAIFIDHNIFHIYPAVDRMIVLDRGKVAGNYKKSEIIKSPNNQIVETIIQSFLPDLFQDLNKKLDSVNNSLKSFFKLYFFLLFIIN